MLASFKPVDEIKCDVEVEDREAEGVPPFARPCRPEYPHCKKPCDNCVIPREEKATIEKREAEAVGVVEEREVEFLPRPRPGCFPGRPGWLYCKKLCDGCAIP
jgi:hypothetical protein